MVSTHQQLNSSKTMPFTSFSEAQEHLFDQVDSIKHKFAALISNLGQLHQKETKTLQLELEQHLDVLVRVVSDLNAASESEIKKWR